MNSQTRVIIAKNTESLIEQLQSYENYLWNHYQIELDDLKKMSLPELQSILDHIDSWDY